MTQRTWDRIEEARERWNVLRHPFYRRWSAGELTREELARYSGQYRHAVRAIATVSEAAADAAPERPELQRHAAEERDHVALWDGFVEAAGGSVADAPTPETEECVRAWSQPGAVRAGGDPLLPSAGDAVRGRERPAGDLPHQAPGPGRPLRIRRGSRARPISASTSAATPSTRPRPVS